MNVLCHFCSDEVEDEIHVLLYCSMYNCVRDQLFKHAVYINKTFMSLNDSEKLHFIFTNNDITYIDVPKPAINYTEKSYHK